IFVRYTFGLVDGHAQHPRFAAAVKLCFHNFNAVGVRHPLSNATDFVHAIHSAWSSSGIHPKNKVGVTPTGTFAIELGTTNQPQASPTALGRNQLLHLL